MMTQSKAAFTSLFAFGLFAALPAQGPSPTPRSVEDLLPASSYGCLHFGGLGACVRAAGRLPAAAVITNFLDRLPAATRERQLDRWLDRAAENVRRFLQGQGLAPGDLRDVLACPIAVGVGRPTIEGMGTSVALAIEVGNHDDAVRRVTAALQSIGERRGVLAGVTEAEIGGHEFRTWQLRGGPTIHLGSIDGRFMISNSRGYLAEIAEVAAGRAPCLASQSTLGSVREQLDGTVLTSLFANTGLFCAMADPVLPYEVGQWADILGLGRLDGIFAGVSAGQHGGTDVLHVGLRGNKGGLLKVAASKPLDLSFAAACSENTVAFGAARLDLPALIGAFDRFLDVLPQQVGSKIRQKMLEEMAREMGHAGTSPKEVHAMLRAFGDQATFALSLENGAVPKPELLVQIGVRDADRVAALMQRIEAAVAEESGLAWKRRDVDGTDIHFLNVEIDGQFKLSPCYALTEKALLLGSDTQS
ncbi:MAG: hypothetical protein KDC98_02065, partial [Planctomycetes bacterium]|nr:hypothetical protein [Planctomycetota bacterium]